SVCCGILSSLFFFFFLMLPRPPISTLFPYTTLFRSVVGRDVTRDGSGCRRECVRAPLRCRLGGGDARRCRAGTRPGTQRSPRPRSEEHTSELQSRENLVCRLLLEKKKKKNKKNTNTT